MSHSTLIHREMDLYQQLQAVKEGRSLEHLCSSVQESFMFKERGQNL
jgi:hypothetical protein